MQLLYPAELARGLRTGGVSGQLAPQQALTQLLAGTGLTWRMTAPNTATLVPAPPAPASDEVIVLPEVNVRAGLIGPSEGSRSYTVDAMNSATRLPLSPRETPQSVSVITQQRIVDRNYATLNEAIEDTPGLFASQGFGDTRWEYFARGFDIDNIQYDGVTSIINNFSRDILVQDNMAMFDRVEVVRGATGLLEGSGNPSATINLVRKRPTRTPQYSMSTSASVWGNARATLDGSSPLNEEGSVRGRFIATYGAGDGYRDYFSQDSLLLYGVVDADLTPSTTVSIGLSYQRENTNGYTWGGLPTRLDGSFFNYSPSTFMGSDWEYLRKNQTTLFLDLEQRLGSDWTLQASARRVWADSDMLSAFTFWRGSQLYKYDRLYDYADDQYAIDVHAGGPIQLFGRQHDIVFGMNAQREELSYVGGLGSTYAIDPENWNPRSVPKPTGIVLGAFSGDVDQRELGFYLSSRWNITDSLKILLGGRLSWYSNSSEVSNTSYSADANAIPYAGIVYDLGRNTSLYASYTRIFKPQLAYDVSGNLLSPAEGSNMEVGVKADFLDRRLMTSVALFELNQSNLATLIDDISYCNPTQYSCYEAADRVRTRGVELEAVGALSDAWNISASYSYSTSSYAEGENQGDPYNTNKVPNHSFKLNSTYRLPGAWSGLVLGAGMRAQSPIHYQGSNFRIKQSGYAVFDLMARYSISERTDFQVNVNNLFDKEYYSSISGLPSYGNFMGPSRNIIFTLNHRF